MKQLITSLIIALLAGASCSTPPASAPHHKEVNSVYYWKTVFKADSSNRAFLRDHNIGRIYLRMFDVTVDKYAESPNLAAIPEASVKVGDYEYRIQCDSLADSELVPVVYITLDALKAMKGREGALAANIVERTRNMCSYNNLPNVGELQLDCDWTASTEDSFFCLCDSVKSLLKSLDDPWKLSSTIRLHQLSGEAPPVDAGVLMVYNTGNFNDPDTDNSIISAADVEPYLKYLTDYPLHLDVAYPTYSWQLLFRERKFTGIMSGLNLSDSTCFTRRQANSFVVNKDISYRNKVLRKGDIIRSETSSYQDIIKVKTMIEKRLINRHHSNILFHLDASNLSEYTHDEIDNILRPAVR